MPVFALVDGVLLEPMGELWVAYSPASGETVLLNDASAAILEILADGELDAREVVAQLAADMSLDAGLIGDVADGCWPVLTNAGLIRAKSAATGFGPR